MRSTAYSLIETARINGIDPEAYLRQVLECIADYPINRIDDLLSWNIVMQPRLQEEAFHGDMNEENRVFAAAEDRTGPYQADDLAPGGGAGDDYPGQAASGDPGGHGMER
jgi:hypothetical protein